MDIEVNVTVAKYVYENSAAVGLNTDRLFWSYYERGTKLNRSNISTTPSNLGRNFDMCPILPCWPEEVCAEPILHLRISTD